MPGLACLQAVTGSFIAENPFRSLIGRNLGFLRRALPGTRRASAKIEGGGGVPSLFSRLPPLSFCQLLLGPLLRVTYYPKWRPRKANTRFSRRRKTPTPTVRLCEVFSAALFDLALSGTASAIIAFMWLPGYGVSVYAFLRGQQSWT